jgi:hypothetical protein
MFLSFLGTRFFLESSENIRKYYEAYPGRCVARRIGRDATDAGTGLSLRKPILRGSGCPDGIQFGTGVSLVQAAFVTASARTLCSNLI